MLYKSKCKSIDCCGIKVVRDVAGEERVDEIVRTTSLATLPEGALL